MGKSIAIKLAILLVVAALVYSVFWFFKVGQVEKQINKFVSDNSSYISASDIAVSGFPLNQKITVKNLKFSIPNSALDKNEIMVPHLEATAGIMDSTYKINLVEPTSVQDADGNVSNVEFSQNPDIAISIADGNITKFHYQDSGYKLLGADKSVSYTASATMIEISSNFESEKITHNISANISGIEGFDVVNLYKNVLERKVIDGIKTNEITLGNAAPAADPNAAAAPVDAAATATNPTAPVAAPVAANTANPTIAPTPAVPAAPAAPTAVPAPVAATAPVPAVATTPAADPARAPTPVAAAPDADGTSPNVPATPTAPDAAPPVAAEAQPVTDGAQPNSVANQAAPTPENAAPIKGDLTIELEYVLTPVQGPGQQANTPPDPTQVLEAPSRYNKLIKISSLEFSNSLYKISVSGEMSSLPDDNLPSGGVSVKIDKIDALVGQISSDFTKIAQKMKPAAEVKPAPAAPSPESQDPAAVVVAAPAPAPIEDPYQVFLTRISAKLGSVSKEIATKNAVSKDQVAQFDVRREKNLDFLINETPMHEILGKF